MSNQSPSDPGQPAVLFGALAPNAPMAGMAYRLTLLLALVPLGTALLLAAALLPEAPSAGFVATLVGGLSPMLVFAAAWPAAMARGRTFRGAGLVHFFVRCVPAMLTPALLWLAFHRVLHETAGAWPFILLAAAIVLHPASRILHEMASPRFELARLWVRQTEGLLVLLAVLGLLSGSIQDAHKDYPTDPTVLLLLLWIVGILLFVAGVLLAAFQWQRLRGNAEAAAVPQPLDEPVEEDAETGGESAPPLEFHTDEF